MFCNVPAGLQAGSARRGDDLHPVAECFKLACPEGVRASLNREGAALDLCEDHQKLIAHDPALQDDVAARVNTMQLEHGLGDVDA